MKPQFKKLFQIGIIVEDLEKSIECYEKVFGMGPWDIAFIDKEQFPALEATSKGKEAGLSHKCAFCKAYGIEIELIQPVGESPYKDWLIEHGPGLHHIAVDTQDKFEDVVDLCENLTGEKVWFHGVEKNIGMDYVYADLTKQIGMFVEFYNEDRSKQPGHDF